MDMVKVDPKLFVTCRLCLEEMGMYQITPVVQHQIKYCFDIEVDQYDGLPQLICSQCENILSEYFTKKRIFVGRQNALKARLQVRKEIEGSLCPSPPPEAVSVSQQNDSEEIATRQKSTSKTKKRKSRVLSSSSSSASVSASREKSGSPAERLNNDDNTINKKYQEKKPPKKRRESWEENYTKKYACKVCNKHIKFGAGIWNHIRTHVNLLSKYQDIINKTCTVKLIKIDDKPNPTGNTNTVVLTQDKIIGQQKENVYVFYTPKKDDSFAENIVFEKKKSEVTYAESENDEDDILNKSKQVKRRRLLSRSSTDTVILNDDDKNPTSDAGKQEKHAVFQNERHTDTQIVCIDIDDSSNGSTQSDYMKDDDNNPVKPKDVEAIKNLIRVCHNKYVAKRQELLDTEIKQAVNKGPQLKRKLLSMGRKVINRQGLPCTGLLRFMESKNLDIKWIPTMLGNKLTNYVRIMPRVKSKDELVPDNVGWKKRPEVPESGHVIILPRPMNVVTSESNPSMSGISYSISNNPTPDENSAGNNVPNLNKLNITITKNSNMVMNSPAATSIERDISSDKDSSSLLFKDLDCDKKLLNAYPVANPKQLPKKCNNTDSKLQQAVIEKVVEKVVTENPEQSLYINLDNEQQDYNTEMPMPIITSTTSLAVSSTDNKEIKTEVNDNTDKSSTLNIGTANEVDKPAPRIKVKPASELMSERVLKNLNQQQSVNDNNWTENSTPAISTANGLGLVITEVTSGGVPVNPNQLIPTTNSNGLGTLSNSRNYIILDTVEMPNTKTESPVQYLRNLLQFHNIVLLESNESLPPNAVCLIKFKLQFLRDSVNQPVTLCLSVHNAGNKFALGVRDPNQVNYIDLNKLSANWQWEILKIYTVREDVINKMLQNAQKVSQDVYEYTKTFFCLLKSISFKKDEVC